MGACGSGKSTFVNYMAGSELEYTEEEFGGEIVVVKSGFKEFTKIAPARNGKIQTKLPCLVPSGKSFGYLDGGGYCAFNTDSIAVTIKNLSATAHAGSILGLVITINFSSEIQDMASGLYPLLNYLEHSIENFKRHAPSILFVVTHAHKRLQPLLL